VDDKFSDVIQYLETQGNWTKCAHHTFPICMLRYTNYAKIQWKYVKESVIINHMKNAILLSQKQHLMIHCKTREYYEEYLPRTVELDCGDEWKPLYLYAKTLVVLKHVTAFSKEIIDIALMIAEEMMKRNPNAKECQQYGMKMVSYA